MVVIRGRPRTRRPAGLRPAQKPSRRKGRTQINLLIGDELRDHLLEAAERHGRTLASEGAAQLESAFFMNRVLAGLGVLPHNAAAQILEGEMRRFGYVPLRDSRGGVVWLPPGHPDNPGRSGFVAAAPGEVAAYLERKGVIEEAAGVGADDVDRRNSELLERSQFRPKFDIEASLKKLEEVEEIAKSPAPSKKGDAA
jgi:hypothetical protein